MERIPILSHVKQLWVQYNHRGRSEVYSEFSDNAPHRQTKQLLESSDFGSCGDQRAVKNSQM